MSHRECLRILRAFSVVIIVTVATPVARAATVTFTDDFSTGLSSNWSVVETTPGLFTIDTTQGDVRLAKNSTPENTNALQNIGVRFDLNAVGGPIAGDFAASVDFLDAVMPASGFIDQIELQAFFADGSIFFDSYDNEGSLNVHVWDGATVRGRTNTIATGGTFGISRVGTTVTGTFNGTSLFSNTETSALTSLRLVLQNNFTSNNQISVTFDNFSLTADSVPAIPLPPAAWGGLGLLGGLVAVRVLRSKSAA